MSGCRTCVAHGSGTKAAKAAGLRRLAQARVARRLDEQEVRPLGDPLEELAALGSRILALEQLLADALAVGDSLTVEGGDDEGGRWAALVPLLPAYQQTLNLARRTLKDLAGLGIEERRVQMAEGQADLVAETMRTALAMVLGLVGQALDAGQLDRARLRAIETTEAPAAVRAAILGAGGIDVEAST